MAKWFGKIGYGLTEETEPGLWEEVVVEHEHYGDLTSDRRSRQSSSDSVNDSINLASTLSIIADPFADQNCANMLYAVIKGAKWKITSIDITQPPRLILTVGGVYNGNTPGASE